MIYIVDFGSQTTHLISRRIKELGGITKIVSPKEAGNGIKYKAKGIILSGGPSSVYQKNAPTIDPNIFSLNVPVLTICYGLQLMTKLLGGKVVSGKKEYGPALLEFKIQNSKFKISKGLPKRFTVWMSHGDEVLKLPEGFLILGSTKSLNHGFVANEKRRIYGVQFHPEVEHTEHGTKILRNFLEICKSEIRLPKLGTMSTDKNLKIKKLKEEIKKTVGEDYVIGAVSGGVDSTVGGVLTAQAIGKQFIPVYIDNGLMREGTKEHVRKIFQKHDVRPIVINAVGEMLKKLKGIKDSEKKRKIIGNFYIKLFEKEMKKQIKLGKNVKFLLQGTIYSDVIESGVSKSSSKIKSHHNVGGLPKNMKLKLLEPLRDYYKDEVKEIGKKLGIPNEFILKQPFPGPGYAVRIRGEVTKERLKKEKKADKIVLQELEKAGILKKVFLSFPVLTDSYSTSVKGDGRFFGEVIALRVLESKDIMTSKWTELPYQVLQKISSRIVNEVPGISRVVYDITTKPPATMEWE